MEQIAIGLGSNTGDRLQSIQTAARHLAADVLTEPRGSAIYETAPWGITQQPAFLNAVLVGKTDWQPPALLHYFKSLEKEMGREVGEPWGPRLIDIDLLAWGNHEWHSAELVVPHPALTERTFVLIPFADVWPTWIHPARKQSVTELLKHLLETEPRNATVFSTALLDTTSP